MRRRAPDGFRERSEADFIRGRGNVYFALIGALIFSLVSKIIFFANIPNAFQTLFGGVIVIVAIAGSQVYTLSSRRAMEESKLT